MPKDYITELVCESCAYTGHVLWDSSGSDRRAITMSTHIRLDAEDKTRFTCMKCGTKQLLEPPA